jgi:Leucine-rich repeat (LRR) protein
LSSESKENRFGLFDCIFSYLEISLKKELEKLDLSGLNLNGLPEEINLVNILEINSKNFLLKRSYGMFNILKPALNQIDLRGNPLKRVPSWFRDLHPDVKILLDTGVWRSSTGLTPY